MYLRIQFTVIAILLLGLAGFNFIVDPYGVYFPESNFEFNRNKTEFFQKEPTIKPYRVSDFKPDTVILGMSSAGLGYDETHAYFSDKSVYNFSMAGASMYMVYRAFQHAMVESDLRNVLLDLSLLSFSEYDQHVVRNDNSMVGTSFEKLIAANEDGSRNWLAMFRRIRQIPQFLLSPQVFDDSYATLMRQGVGTAWHLNSHGGWRGTTLPANESQVKRFRQTTAFLINGFFKSGSSTQLFSIYREDGGLSRAFEYYERFLDDAYRHDIHVTLVLSPNHVYFYEALDYLGFGEMLADWKRNVVLINERVATRHGKTPFPIWDFAYYSAVNTEPLPAKENTTARMRWFYDPLHFTRHAGDQVLDQIFLGNEGPGLKLDSNNADTVLEMQQLRKQQFHRENPEQIRQLKILFDRASRVNSPEQ